MKEPHKARTASPKSWRSPWFTVSFTTVFQALLQIHSSRYVYTFRNRNRYGHSRHSSGWSTAFPILLPNVRCAVPTCHSPHTSKRIFFIGSSLMSVASVSMSSECRKDNSCMYALCGTLIVSVPRWSFETCVTAANCSPTACRHASSICSKFRRRCKPNFAINCGNRSPILETPLLSPPLYVEWLFLFILFFLSNRQPFCPHGIAHTGQRLNRVGIVPLCIIIAFFPLGNSTQ